MEMNKSDVSQDLETQLSQYDINFEDFEKKGLMRLEEAQKPYGHGLIMTFIFTILKKIGIYDQPKAFKKKLTKRLTKSIEDVEKRINKCHSIQEDVLKLSQKYQSLMFEYEAEKKKFEELLKAAEEEIKKEQNPEQKRLMEGDINTINNKIEDLSELIVTYKDYSQQYMNQFHKLGVVEMLSKKIRLGLQKSKSDIETQISFDMMSYYKFQKSQNKEMQSIERFLTDLRRKEKDAMEFIASVPVTYKKPFSQDYSAMHKAKKEELHKKLET